MESTHLWGIIRENNLEYIDTNYTKISILLLLYKLLQYLSTTLHYLHSVDFMSTKIAKKHHSV